MGDSIKAYHDELAKHEAAEERMAEPLLKALDAVGVDRITLGDLRLLLTLKADTHGRRVIIKRMYEKYVGPTAYVPKADI